MADRIQQRRDTKARWEQFNPVLLEGEVGYVLDDVNRYKIGDGVHNWNDLPFRGFDGTIVHDIGNSENVVMSQKAVSEKLSELGKDIDGVNTVSDDVFSIKDRFVYTNGQLMSTVNFVCTDFIYIKGIDYLYFKAEENQQNLYLAVYGKDKTFNSGSQQQYKNSTEWNIIKFEDSDYYIRFSKRTGTKFYIKDFGLIDFNKSIKIKDYGNPIVINENFIDNKKRGFYYDKTGNELNSGTDYYGITKEIIPLSNVIYLKNIEHNDAINVVFYDIYNNISRVVNVGIEFTEIKLENKELYFRISINTRTPLFVRGFIDANYSKISIPKIYDNGYLLWKGNDNNVKKDTYIPSVLNIGEKISFASASNSIVSNKVHLSEEDYYCVVGAMNNTYEGIFFCDENDIIVDFIVKGKKTDIFKSWNNNFIFRTPTGTKHAYITISLSQTLDKSLDAIKVLQWNGIDEMLIKESLIVDNYASNIIYEKEYIKNFDNSEVIYNSLEDHETLLDYYYALNEDGIINAYKDKLPEGSGWLLSKEIDVTPCSTIRIEGLDYSNWDGKTVIFRHGVTNYAYTGFIWGKSYTNTKRTQEPYNYDVRNFVFNSIQELKIPYTCTSIRLVIKTNKDLNIVPIVIKKWDGSYNKTYRLRKKRIDFSNLTWAALGDSVTWLNSHPWGSGSQGKGMSDGYQNIVRKSIKFKDVQDYAENGQALVNLPGQYLLGQSYNWKKADIYTIMLGINSCTVIANTKLGTISDFKNKTGSNTLYGAWREMLDYIYNTNPLAHVFVCVPHQIISASTDDGIKTVEGYDVVNNVSIEIAKLNNIPIIDIYHESGINVYNNSITTYDGVHPSNEGYKRIGSMILNSFIKHIVDAN